MVSTEEDLLSAHTADWSGWRDVAPIALLRPRTTEDVSAALKICHARRQPVAIQGGLTGLCGGASTHRGEIALSLARLTGIDEVEPGAITVRAGTLIGTVQDAARAHNAELGIDFGARGSAMVGGAIATNAGGLHVIETGMTRAQVLGLEVVLADGRILSELTAMVKVNSGFDLKQLFIGSEGALGVITGACFQLRPLRAGLSTAVLALREAAGLLPALAAARSRFGPDLSAFEAMWSDYVETMTARTPFGLPLEAPMTVILEVRAAAESEAMERMESFLSDASGDGWLADAVIAQSSEQARSLWALRDEGPALYDQIFADKVVFDISVPAQKIHEAAASMAEAAAHRADLHPLTYGHIGDNNLHFVFGADTALSPAEKRSIEHDVYHRVAALGGAISAEHGIGMTKKDYLGLTRSPVARALMRDLKRTLDPRGILNPGRVIDV
ncbi:MAG: FAD-binding oxidoreductase [Pseudomonadota bacterium]